MVVMALAGVVTLGLVGFYLNSQATWMDASAQALAQRDATSVLEAIANHARDAADVTVTPNGGDTVLTFFKVGGIEPYSFWWDQQGDSLLHQAEGTGDVDGGPVTPSTVERFYFEWDPALKIVHVRVLEVRSAQGERVQVSSSFALYNVAR